LNYFLYKSRYDSYIITYILLHSIVKEDTSESGVLFYYCCFVVKSYIWFIFKALRKCVRCGWYPLVENLRATCAIYSRHSQNDRYICSKLLKFGWLYRPVLSPSTFQACDLRRLWNFNMILKILIKHTRIFSPRVWSIHLKLIYIFSFVRFILLLIIENNYLESILLM